MVLHSQGAVEQSRWLKRHWPLVCVPTICKGPFFLLNASKKRLTSNMIFFALDWTERRKLLFARYTDRRFILTTPMSQGCRSSLADRAPRVQQLSSSPNRPPSAHFLPTLAWLRLANPNCASSLDDGCCVKYSACRLERCASSGAASNLWEYVGRFASHSSAAARGFRARTHHVGRVE